MDFSEVLKELRIKRKISQAKLADDLNLSPGLIGMYENGSRKPSYESLEAIADYFNVSLDFLTGKDDKSIYYSYGGKSLQKRSHGESFIELFGNFKDGIFILDEPEAALSPERQLALMAMIDESEDTELLDLIIEHKRQEINLANKKYNLYLKCNEIGNTDKKNYIAVMSKILNGSNDAKYCKACKEVLEILKYIPNEYYNRINKNFIERLEKNSDNNYNISITENTQYKDLNILQETKEILTLISNKFWSKNGKNIEIIEIFNKKGEM